MPDNDNENQPNEQVEAIQFEPKFNTADWFTMLVLFGACFLAMTLILSAINSLPV